MHRLRRHRRGNHRRRRDHHGLRRHRRDHPDGRQDGPHATAWRRGSDAGACCRDWDGDRPGRGRDDRHRDADHPGRRRRDDHHRDADRPDPVRDGQPDAARAPVPTNTGCCPPAACAGPASGRDADPGSTWEQTVLPTRPGPAGPVPRESDAGWGVPPLGRAPAPGSPPVRVRAWERPASARWCAGRGSDGRRPAPTGLRVHRASVRSCCRTAWVRAWRSGAGRGPGTTWSPWLPRPCRGTIHAVDGPRGPPPSTTPI